MPLLSDLFDELIVCLDAALQTAIQHGSLSAHEAQAQRRHNLLLAYLSALDARLSELDRPSPSAQLSQHFLRQYSQQAVARFGRISLNHLDAQRKVPLDDIYIAPAIHIPSPHSRAATLSLTEYQQAVHRDVLLGNPGAGKSTFAMKHCFDIASRALARNLASDTRIPIMVTLHEYGAWRSANSASILTFIIQRCLLQVPCSSELIYNLAADGRLFVVFDGLDELLDTQLRTAIRDDVESFCSLYPSIPALVTSRQVGYEQAPLDLDTFRVSRLGDFTPEHVRLFTQKWFALDTTLSEAQRTDFVTAFDRDSRIVSDLRSNPLMLSLMCNLYKGERYIPRNRPDVYEKCAVLLFEKWDPSRGIHVNLPFEAHVSPAMKHLAHWIYANPELQQGVTEGRLIAEAQRYLNDRRYEDPDEAHHAARSFVEYCRGRAWVFTDIGSTGGGEAIYQFTHRTFLEYFAASYLVRSNPTPKALFDALSQRIRLREWDVVAQLAFQIQAKNTDESADTLLKLTLHASEAHISLDRLNFLSFAARSLEFLVPSPRVARDTVRECLLSSIEAILLTKTGLPQDRLDIWEGIIVPLAIVRADNRAAVTKAASDTLVLCINTKEFAHGRIATNVAFHWQTAMDIYERRDWHADAIDLQEVKRRVTSECHDRLRKLAVRYCDVAIDCYKHDIAYLRELLLWHRGDAVFSRRVVLYPPRVFFPSIAEATLSRCLRSGFDQDIQSWELLDQIGHELLRIPPPWIEAKTGRWLGRHVQSDMEADSIASPARVDGGRLFAVLCVLAPFVESNNEGIAGSLFKTLQVCPLAKQVGGLYRLMVDGRASGDELLARDVSDEMIASGCSEQHASLISSWMRLEVDLISRRPRRKTSGDTPLFDDPNEE